MAILRNINGMLRGRLGNVVYQRSNNSKTFVRAYVANIKNPRTQSQCLVRAKMQPASAVYQKLQELLNHSQGEQPYISRNRFMSYALRAKAFPFLVKGAEYAAIPGEYRVSEGMLPTLTYDVQNVSTADNYNNLVTNLLISNGNANYANLVRDNFDRLSAGDQLTVVCAALNDDGDIEWALRRYAVDTSDDTVPQGFIVVGGRLNINLQDFFAVQVEVIAACIIRTSIVNGKYVYSTETFHLGSGFYAFVDATSYRAMIASYQAVEGGRSGSNLYLRKLVGNQPSSGVMPASADIISVMAALTSNNYVEVGAVQRADGLYILTTEEGGVNYICSADGDKLTQANQPISYASVKSGQFAGVWVIKRVEGGGEENA